MARTASKCHGKSASISVSYLLPPWNKEELYKLCYRHTERASAVGDWDMLLYNTRGDRFDMNPITVKANFFEALRLCLPDGGCPDAQPSALIPQVSS